ncbi:arabinofuranosidase catalytic domain-containing protein [Ancylobacter radicis]|uniref:Alpha-L-arabinofuranosidase B catalytic domain-containing protein n=1 Tax=Ancylobacter radicis TaxID=2836179 RepID=A0ABS5RCK2_9HYPH|nr:arabinofuranosidase catalytic domain-containing protein [Ancylobacter radicis]MBS9478832.1 hypothetical protein [Ancylobacter radicis]
MAGSLGLSLGFGPGAARRRAGPSRAPLDGLALYAAHGLRRMFSAHTGPLLRARRGSDHAQADFGPRGDGWLDIAALLAWGGSASVFLVTLYDQTGNDRHAGQSSAGAQPRLVQAGSAELGPGGRPVALFDGIDDWLAISDSLAFSQAQANLTLAAVVARTGVNAAAGNQQIVYAPSGGTSVLTRASLALFAADGYRAVAGGRRLDTDAFTRVTAADALAPGIWGRLIGRVRYGAAQADIVVNGASTSGPFQTAGTSANTVQGARVLIGATNTNGEPFSGGLSAVLLAQTALDVAALDAALGQMLP